MKSWGAEGNALYNLREGLDLGLGSTVAETRFILERTVKGGKAEV